MSKKQLLFATNNLNKVQEMREIIGSDYQILGLEDLNILVDIPETGQTFVENARIKAHFLYERFDTMCLAEDSGLEVNTLNGAPGIYSARYSTDASISNIDWLLQKLGDTEQRGARFVTVISLYKKGGDVFYFKGICEGRIARKPKGNNGFGYDSIFIPNGYNQTFGELPSEVKNTISHRKKALQLLVSHFNPPIN